ncbi:GNAT family N-acetyltransferase [Sulfitobacter sp. D35]|uniref:GNAT family N-acetyltransferase n=1 Tax=Sulfitobacter sp. D35 TaxID=3083252 RepID=UPI00296FF9D7|nr:GNAT family N-acetyltransferase [Sulfitobacter sp. D35]MDW4497300.1 GNAT family N-acetyltransferase [Sulfitobacter sp. D35]
MIAVLADTPVLETDRLILRAPRFEDYAVFEPFFLSRRSEFIGAWPDPTPGKAWRSFCHVAGMWALKGVGSFVYCDRQSGAPLGHSGPWVPPEWPENEIGWTVWSEAAEGKGYAFEAASAARAYAYDTLGWTTAVSYIDPDNARSIALAERLGCRVDASANAPDSGLGKTPLVYRHPAPEAVA